MSPAVAEYEMMLREELRRAYDRWVTALELGDLAEILATEMLLDRAADALYRDEF